MALRQRQTSQSKGKEASDETGSNESMKGLEALSKQVEGLVGVVGQLTNGMKVMQDNMSTLATSVSTISEHTSTGRQDADDDEDEDDDVDLERLDRKGFMQHLMKEFNKNLSKYIAGVNDQLSTVKEDFSKNQIVAQWKELQAKHPEVVHWTDEIKKVAEDNPGLSLSRMYTLAKAENPDKVEEVEKLMAEADGNSGDSGKESKEDQQDRKKGFGGLTPTSGHQTDLPTDMDSKQAAQAAWDKTMQDIDLAALGESD